MKPKTISLVVFGCGFAVLGIFALLPLLHVDGERAPRASAEMIALLRACELYQDDHGSFPTGPPNQIVEMLLGLSGGKIYVDWDSVPDEGFLDPWGTRYRIEGTVSGEIRVRSAGRDGTWGTGDDLEVR